MAKRRENEIKRKRKHNMNNQNSNALDAKKDVKVLRMSRYLAPVDFIFKIQSFSSLLGWATKRIQLGSFESGGFKWRLCLSLSGSNKEEDGGDYISLYLSIAGIDKRPSGWEVNVNVKLFLFNQIENKYVSFQDGKVWAFHCLRTEWGFEQLLPLSTFSDPANGYLVDDSCAFGAEIYVIKPNNVIFKSVDLSKTFKSPIFTWKIKDYSKSATTNELCSPEFIMGGWKWKLELYPNGWGSEVGKSISLFLRSVDVDSLSVSELEAKYKLRIKDQVSGRSKESAVVDHKFCFEEISWGFPACLSLKDLKDKANTYIHGDSLVVEVEFIYLSMIRVLYKD